MKVLTYVDGVLTVINNDKFYSNNSSKPSFIKGNTFYYEPTLKIMDGVNLSSSLQKKAEEFIGLFVFPELKHCVNQYGEYIGHKYQESEDIEVLDMPPSNGVYLYDFSTLEWVEHVIVGVDGKIKENNHKEENDIYVKKSLMLNAPSIWMTYNKNNEVFELDIIIAKNDQLRRVSSDFYIEVINLTGAVFFGEMETWKQQEDEARGWMADNTTITPFIDALLVGRNLGETKEVLVNKIITKADAYKVFYGKLLGKLHAKQKQIEAAVSLNDIVSTVWA